jgi:hypothetical protein
MSTPERPTYRLTPEFLGRLNRFSPVLERLQAGMTAKQGLRAASKLDHRLSHATQMALDDPPDDVLRENCKCCANLKVLL